ncbi:PD40 domain-containing protein [Dyadobacter psychrophilus]|uniref:WD40-like Beta Propeller Repeat n=1 Tax=Dyadobacter psychrophilus TaxID=651661 RepID=A0A1T5DZR7_9BACT|nr:PD40 domain-containing protein [Dyadobacter psychrophilus]SKB77247.1 WD40-like Beta Propeller Repeat [Dyadobacter psychrophilus]
MNHLQSIFTALLVLPHVLLAQKTISESSTYLNQKFPGAVPTVFAPGLISLKDHYEYGSVFSKDGKEFYYAVIINEKPQIRYSYFANNTWTSPKTVIGSDKYEYNDPFLSADGKGLFFISDQAKDGKGDKKDFDIWYLEREKDGWSQIPVNAGTSINTGKNEYYMSFTQTGKMYFSSNGGTDQASDKNYDVRSSLFSKSGFTPSIKLGKAVNTEHYEADVFVSPDEQYIIFCSERPGGLGKGDLYISFKSKSGEWQNAKNMGKEVNTEGYEFCPFVTGDGKYLFFSRDGDIFWMSAKLIDSLR